MHTPIDPPAQPSLHDELLALAAPTVTRDGFESTRPIVGAPLTLARRIVLRLLRPYLQVVASNQAQFNSRLAEAVVSLDADAAHLRCELEEARRDNRALIQYLNQLEKYLNQLETEVHSIRDNLNPRVWMNEDLSAKDPSGRTTIGYAATDRQGSGAPRAASPYAAFERVFRGSGDRVKSILTPLVGYFDGCSRVLDFGCGGGEFLSLLTEANITSEGVDTDSGMLAIARFRGLKVTEADGIEWLRTNKGRYDGLFAGQVVEHLDFEQITVLLDIAVTCLKPGAVVVLETPNPYSSGGSQAFRLDPTHRTLLFPETLVVLARHAGFESAEIAFPGEWDALDSALRREPTYALVGRVPPAP